jgi:hypothetical protein
VPTGQGGGGTPRPSPSPHPPSSYPQGPRHAQPGDGWQGDPHTGRTRE